MGTMFENADRSMYVVEGFCTMLNDSESAPGVTVEEKRRGNESVGLERREVS